MLDIQLKITSVSVAISVEIIGRDRVERKMEFLSLSLSLFLSTVDFRRAIFLIGFQVERADYRSREFMSRRPRYQSVGGRFIKVASQLLFTLSETCEIPAKCPRLEAQGAFQNLCDNLSHGTYCFPNIYVIFEKRCPIDIADALSLRSPRSEKITQLPSGLIKREEKEDRSVGCNN